MAVRCLPMDDRDGRPVLVGIAKMTYAVDAHGRCSVAVPSVAVRTSEIRYGDGGVTSLHYPSDVAPEKPGTDIVLVGSARPPAGASQMDLSLRVGLIHKQVRLHGPRVYASNLLGRFAPGPPAPLPESVPLRYELAWGGTDPESLEREERNPAGVGFAATRHNRLGAAAPQLEIPASLTERNNEPAGFAAIPADWSPRRQWAGTFDSEWRRRRAPLAPQDFDPRHYSVAHPDLWSERPLLGDEPVEVIGVSESGAWRFKLPNYAPSFTSLKEGQLYEHPTHLDTFLIDADEGRVELTWRAQVRMPRKVELLEKITVREAQSLPADIPVQAPAA